MSLLSAQVAQLAANTGEYVDPYDRFAADTGWIIVIKAVLVLVFLLLMTLACIVVERKVVGWMQTRPGPNMNGPFGSLQSLADALKLLFKEDITVRAADKIVYLIAPIISVFAALIIFAVIPMGADVQIPFTDIVTPLQLTDVPVGVLFVLACASFGVYGIVLGGWSSGSTYPLLGSVRSTAQVISYELAMGMSLVSVFIMSKSMSTGDIVAAQQDWWWCIILFPAFVIYVISMVGETNRAPFDLPEAEGELVGGFHTEYSSMKFAWFFLAEYVNMINVSAVATTLFLGGWRAPWPLSTFDWANEGWITFLWFFIKVWLCLFLFIWLRGTLPRFRYDQFMKFGWKVLIPAALVWIVIVALGQATGFAEEGNPFRMWIFGGFGVVFLLLVVWLFLPDSAAKRRAQEEAEAEAKRTGVLEDPFEDGFPVPPLPGQTLPPSPRQREREAQSALVVEATATEVIAEEAAPAANEAGTTDSKEADRD